MPKTIEYWIASYSVHAQVLDNLLSESNGIVRKLCVNAAGLRAPRMVYRNSDMLKKTFFPERTLHAKVLLRKRSDFSEVWLWTGNLRKATYDSQNILLSLPIGNPYVSQLENWFKAPSCNLAFYSDGKQITDFKPLENEKCLWCYIKDSMCRIVNNDDDYRLYAFSPWGSATFIKNVSELDFLLDCKFYTRNEDENVHLWVDKAENGHAFVPRRKWFPHFKCMFLTKIKRNPKTNEEISETLVWTYIGSANFTYAAMFNKGKSANIEHALFFEGANANKENIKLYEYLTDAKNDESSKCLWKKRKTFGKESLKIEKDDFDESSQEKDEENDWQESLSNFDNFDSISFWQKYINILMDENVQSKLDEAYQNNTDWIGGAIGRRPGISVKVLSVDNLCFHVLAHENTRKPSGLYERDIPRIIDDDLPLSCDDACAEIDDLFKGESFDKKINGLRVDEFPESVDESSSSPNINVRFQPGLFYKKVKNGRLELDRALLNRVFDKLDNIKKRCDKGILTLKSPYDIFLSIWYPMVKKLRRNNA